MGGGNAVGENGNEAKGARGTRREKKSGLVIFFQAEDGIRDIGVTGVQTCALPISVSPSVCWNGAASGASAGRSAEAGATSPMRTSGGVGSSCEAALASAAVAALWSFAARASGA